MGSVRFGGFDEDEDDLRPDMPDERDLELSLGTVVEEDGRLIVSGLGGAEDMLYAARLPRTTSCSPFCRTGVAAPRGPAPMDSF